ncbi:AbrB family transcriptional regulator [Siccirubricoccus sp. KC 17139]|uniref:AbrB family transcriptional regulator n=1 Tax=Siccirubricoccus soli TaxID=2899147 RepID=A0ABT1D4Z6_9PROT|nr:AbrB family transcriptional regulator [Siccirubricoccus soli]MCO6416994.1 AbrB family transcriptional regulator [Siccirubricoccus soli]MCP2683129.1 AbrB family transcriptional regulator [Siccirubricoccus soli]
MPTSLPLQLRTLAAASLGGALLTLLHIPLAWMIGAMLGTATLAWNQFPVAVPSWARPAGLVFLGLSLGASFSGPVLTAVMAALPVMLVGGVLAIASGLVVAQLFTRLAGTDQKTGFFCAVPGGVVVMAVLAQEAKASVATVTLAQTMRVLVVVLTFPPLLGWLAPHGDFTDFTAAGIATWWPGLLAMAAAGLACALPLRQLGLANPWMLGPCALAIGLAATGHLPSAVPKPLVDAAQVAMGATLGTRLTRSFLLSSRRLAIAALISSAVLSLLLTALGVLVAWVSGLPVSALILGLAPGGMPEMALTAKALELGVPLVLGFHLTRTVLCNLLVGPLHRGAVRLGLL